MKFTKPNPLNGETLIKELSKIGINLDLILVNADGELELNVTEKDKTKVLEVLNNHDGSDTIPAREAARKSALSKLIDLGLTEEEIAAL